MDYKTGKWIEELENRIANIESIISEIHPEYSADQEDEASHDKKNKKKVYEKKEYGKTA